VTKIVGMDGFALTGFLTDWQERIFSKYQRTFDPAFLERANLQEISDLFAKIFCPSGMQKNFYKELIKSAASKNAINSLKLLIEKKMFKTIINWEEEYFFKSLEFASNFEAIDLLFQTLETRKSKERAAYAFQTGLMEACRVHSFKEKLKIAASESSTIKKSLELFDLSCAIEGALALAKTHDFPSLQELLEICIEESKPKSWNREMDTYCWGPPN
ncbi:MAG: hypothetical protein V4487_02475, partial [Chlamydiota bacterium]